MPQDIVNNNQSISYTNLDFASIYTEVLDLVKNLTYRWDPSISDESDPGVILVKLSALLADKCNYNIDKSILETFPLSVTQESNAQQLYEQLGYYMNWYESARCPIAIRWVGPEEPLASYTIPKFTIVTNDEETINYSIIGVEGADGVVVSDGILNTDGTELRMVVMEGTPTTYTYLGNDTVITAQMVDKNTRRIYFNTNSVISQNGIFITNTKQNNYADWKRVDNIYEQSYNELRYKFGYDNYSNACYLEFPDNYAELFGDGIEITYLSLKTDVDGSVPTQTLSKFLQGVIPKEDNTIILDTTTVTVQNYASSVGHRDKETINEAYSNYQKTVGTFHTLITLRDYLNYIRSRELDVCSNAFVCDRTNDIQSTYKIVSKQHNLDSIIVKVEQVVNKTAVESNFNYTFEKTTDTTPIEGKKYYTITNDELQEVVSVAAENPKEKGWYEFKCSIPSTEDALDEFSLKFYLLKNAISLNSKTAFNETFEPFNYNDELNLDSLLEDTAHLEHTYEDLLPLGENSYKETLDATFLEHKAYYIKDDSGLRYVLFTNYEIGDSTNLVDKTVYEVDVEALLPHTVLLKNIYPLTVRVSTYDALNEETQKIVQENVLNALYAGVNSSQLHFGESIDVNYLSEIVESCDDRIKKASFDSINYYTKAVYYSGANERFEEVILSDTVKDLSFDQKNFSQVVAHLIEKDIICKSILAGVTYLVTPDDTFTFHLNQKFIDYVDDISSITSQAVIDIGGEDVITTYSSETANPYIRKSYVLKPNEQISLYRPQLETLREFSSGIHFECFLYNGIKGGQSYQLQKNEYIVFFQTYYGGDERSGMPDGFSTYACTEGVIITPSFDIAPQTNYGALTSFTKSRIIPHFEAFTDNWYELSTYATVYVSEIYNSASILNNAISGTNTVKLQSAYTTEIETSDHYKFFWVLNTPQYSNDKKIKTYTLFPEYDVSTERTSDKEKNTYTLKEGEWLYYTDATDSNLSILGAGTTLQRVCGKNEVYDDDNANVAFTFVNINEFGSSGTDMKYKDGILETITTNSLGDGDVINPKENGWYEKILDDPATYERTTDIVVDPDTEYYVLVMLDNSGLYKRIGDEPPYQHSSTLESSDVFSEVDVQSYLSNVNPKEEGLYEIVTCMDSRVSDYYALSDGASYNNYLRYTETLDETVLSRYTFNDANYSDIDISDVETYRSITITPQNANAFDYVSQKLVVPALGDASYKTYYTDNTGEEEVTDIRVIDDPSTTKNHLGTRWYEYIDGAYRLTNDERPVISFEQGSVRYPTTLTTEYCFEEVVFDDWNSVSFLDNGYFFKLNSAEYTYNWERGRTTINELVSTNSFSYLLSLYTEARKHYPTDISSLIRYMIQSWKTTVTYHHPFRLNTNLGWRTRGFNRVGSVENATHVGISKSIYREYFDRFSSYETYPRYEMANDGSVFVSPVDVILPKHVLELGIPELDVAANYIPLVITDDYVNILDRVANSDEALGAYLKYLYECFNEKIPNLLQLELPVKVYRFKDLYRLTTKQYFKPNLYVSKIFDPVDPWTCVAVDNDVVAKDPINVISGNKDTNDPNKWQYLQNNTSLRIIKNEIWSFAEGDVLRFEAPVVSQNSVAWPRFSNTEVPLDLDSYSISYQRNGGNIEDINKVQIEGFDWQGYSRLLLNTASKDGQKLEQNHSIILYKPFTEYSEERTYKIGDKCVYDNIVYDCIVDILVPETFNPSHWEEGQEYFGIINGSDFENTTFQLKYPVNNMAGRYIDVTTRDMFGDVIFNSLYEFTPLVNNTSYYVYGSDYNTYVKFDVDHTTKDVINSKVQIPLLLPQGRYLLPVHTEVAGVRYLVSKYMEAYKGNVRYCINSSPSISPNNSLTIRISHSSDSHGENYGEFLYGFDKDKFTGTASTDYYINDTKYHYLDFSVDINPEYDGFVKVKLPAHLSEYYSYQESTQASPVWFGWYELIDGEYVLSEDTGLVEDLLEEVEIETTDFNEIKQYNPNELVWYEKVDNHYVLTTDKDIVVGKTYYKDRDFYLPSSAVSSPSLKIYCDNPLEKIDREEVQIIFGDVFKYNPNDMFTDSLYEELRQKIRRLDNESLYNYTYRINSNDEIKDPLSPTMMFENNHVFNDYVIPQLDFDDFNCIFTTRSGVRRR